MIIAISVTLFFLVLRFTVTLFNFISNPKLTRVSKQYTDLISILIPVKDEEENILTLLQSIYVQDYTNYEVIIYDDHSTDRTLSICSDFTVRDKRFNIIKGIQLLHGWTSKNFACDLLAQKAKGKYLLFLNADSSIKNNLINSAIHRMHLYKLSLLSLFTNQEMKTIGEKATAPLLHYMLLNLLPLRLVYLLKNPSVASASGQFMLFDSARYLQNQWHRLVKNKVVGYTQIMKLVKAASCNGEVLLANGMISSKMFRSYKDALNGCGNHFLAAFNYSIPGILTYLLLIIVGPMLVIITLNISLIFFMISLILLTRFMISLSAGQNALENILLHPVQMINLLVIGFLVIQKHLVKTNV